MIFLRDLERMFFRAVVAACVVCLGACPAWAAADGVSLAEELFPQLEGILKDALAQSPTMLKKNLERMEAEGRRMEAVSNLYPDVGGNFDAYEQRERRLQSNGTSKDKPGFKFRYELAATYPLYHWGAMKARADLGRIGAAIAANNVREAYRSLALSIRARYLDLVLSKTSLRNERRSLESLQRKLRLVREEAASGDATGGSVASAELAITEKELAIDRAEFALEVALRAFRRLTGRPDFSAEEVPLEIPAVATLAEDRTSVLRADYERDDRAEQSVTLANLRMQFEQETKTYRIQRVQLRPRLNLRAGFNQEEISYSEDVAAKYRVNAAFVGLRCDWNIFDGFAARGQTQATRMRMRSFEMRIAEQREDLLNAVADAATELGFSARGLALKERGYAGAKSAVTRARQMAEDGRGAEGDVIDAELALNKSELDAFRVRADYLSDLALFYSLLEADPVVNALAAPTIRR